jgi:hypothetical protein
MLAVGLDMKSRENYSLNPFIGKDSFGYGSTLARALNDERTMEERFNLSEVKSWTKENFNRSKLYRMVEIVNYSLEHIPDTFIKALENENKKDKYSADDKKDAEEFIQFCESIVKARVKHELTYNEAYNKLFIYMKKGFEKEGIAC